MEGTDAALITTMGDGDVFGFTEHYAKRIIIGDLENTRAGLKSALEKLGYFVETEQPLLIAKRKTRLSAKEKKFIVGNALSHVKRLRISLSSANENSTVANFSYAIMNSALMKGDRRTIEAEIDALAALTTSRQLQTLCAACGTGNTDDSRFCRVCGVPNAFAEPAELEVLRLTANARSAHQMIVGGAIFTFCWLDFVATIFITAQNDRICRRDNVWLRRVVGNFVEFLRNCSPSPHAQSGDCQRIDYRRFSSQSFRCANRFTAAGAYFGDGRNDATAANSTQRVAAKPRNSHHKRVLIIKCRPARLVR